MTRQEKITKAQEILTLIRRAGLKFEEVCAVEFASQMQEIADGYNEENPSDEPEDKATIYSEARSFVECDCCDLSSEAWAAFEELYGPQD
jgi:hypothetical protein